MLEENDNGTDKLLHYVGRTLLLTNYCNMLDGQRKGDKQTIVLFLTDNNSGTDKLLPYVGQTMLQTNYCINLFFPKFGIQYCNKECLKKILK